MNMQGYTGRQLGTFACNYGLQYRKIALCSTDGPEAEIPLSSGKLSHRHAHLRCDNVAFAT